MGGGKSQTSTQSVSIPPEVLARYNSVNAQAQTAAANPFQPYTGEFVAPVNAQQQAGISATNTAASQAQPYYGAATQQLGQAQGQGQGYLGAATGAAFAGAMPVNPSGLDVNAYMNPYTQNVVGATQAALNQQFGQQNAAQQAQAIKAGAFGGERAGLQNAQLQGQQALTESQAIAPLYQANYNQALAAAQQQQGVGLSAAQANRTALQGLGSQLAGLGQQGFTQGTTTAQQLAGLGTGAQTAALQGAQAQTAAGTLQQQTQQAGDTAQYQQYLQQQGYPFQVAQFLAGIAEGTGALSGSTTTTTQPAGFFSDERLKTDIKEIGKTNDGQKIYSYKYKGDDRTQIGLMAQDVEKSHPDAVGLMGGYKTVDYKKATEDAERPARATGGLIPAEFDASSMGGAVTSDMAGEAYARGGYALGGDPSNPYGAAGYVPSAPQSVPHQLMIAPGLRAPPQSGMSTAMQTGKDIQGLYNFGKSGLVGTAATKDSPASAGLLGGQGNLSGKNVFSDLKDGMSTPSAAASGGLIAPHGYADGGDVDPYELSRDPLKKTIEEQKVTQLLLPKSNSTPGSSQSGLGQLTQGLGAAKGLYDMGSGVASGLGSLGTGFSSAANAGTLDSALGAGFFADNIGLGAAGASAAAPGIMGSIGSFLGSLGPAGFLLGAKDGGAIPRQAHADGDRVIPDYSAEADLPSAGAQEAGLAHDPDASFQRASENLLKREGGLGVDNNGALVNFGMNQAAHPEINVRDLTKEDAIRKYRSDYWNPIGGDKLPPDLANVALDTAAMAGPAKARNLLQSSGGDPVDMLHQRQQFLQNLVSSGKLNDDGSPRYGPNVAKSWQNRYESMLGELGAKPQVNLSGPTPKGVVGGGIDSTPPSGGEGKKSLGDIVTSEGFVVPALGFLGSMLASQRPTFGGALGEGLLGGTGAYMAQQRQNALIDQTQVKTAADAINAAKSSLDFQNKIVYGKNMTPMLMSKWIALTPQQQAEFGLAGGALAAPYVTKAVNQFMQPSLQVPPISQEKTPGQILEIRKPEEPSAVQTSAAPNIVQSPFSVLGQASVENAKHELANSFDPMNSAIAAQKSADYAKRTSSGAEIARANYQNIGSLATAVSSRIQNMGMDTPGTAFAGRNELVKIANTISGAVGGQPISEGPDNEDKIQKLAKIGGAETAKNYGQESNEALNTMISAFPNGNMGKDAQADLTAHMAMLNVKAQDKDDHQNQYAKMAGTQGFTEAGIAFDKDNSNRYMPEKNLYKQAILRAPDQVRQMYSGGATPTQIDAFFKELSKQTGVQYMPNMSRYFVRGQ